MYILGEDVFNELPQEAQAIIEKDGTIVSDEKQIEEIQQIIGPNKADEPEAPKSFDDAESNSMMRMKGMKSKGMMSK